MQTYAAFRAFFSLPFPIQLFVSELIIWLATFCGSNQRGWRGRFLSVAYLMPVQCWKTAYQTILSFSREKAYSALATTKLLPRGASSKTQPCKWECPCQHRCKRILLRQVHVLHLQEVRRSSSHHSIIQKQTSFEAGTSKLWPRAWIQEKLLIPWVELTILAWHGPPCSLTEQCDTLGSCTHPIGALALDASHFQSGASQFLTQKPPNLPASYTPPALVAFVFLLTMQRGNWVSYAQTLSYPLRCLFDISFLMGISLICLTNIEATPLIVANWNFSLAQCWPVIIFRTV